MEEKAPFNTCTIKHKNMNCTAEVQTTCICLSIETLLPFAHIHIQYVLNEKSVLKENERIRLLEYLEILQSQQE